MSIEEQNKLIGFFMGMKLVETLQGFEYYEFKGPAGFTINALKYHSSWDWLMPVIKKIGDYLQTIDRPSKNHCCKGDLLEVDITCAIHEIDILLTHKAVIEFILWYNTQNK